MKGLTGIKNVTGVLFHIQTKIKAWPTAVQLRYVTQNLSETKYRFNFYETVGLRKFDQSTSQVCLFHGVFLK